MRPADIYAGGPTQSQVRTVLGDSSWWQGPPSFGVSPLDAATTPLNVKFTVGEQFIHLGTQEAVSFRHTVYDTTASATTEMTNIKTAFPNAPTSPKVGDDVVYNVQLGTGAAPFLYQTFVRVGQVVTQIVWAKKDLNLTVQQLSKLAQLIVQDVKSAITGTKHASTQAVDAKLLPVPGLDLTLLGSAQLPIESWVVMTHTPLAQAFFDLVHQQGISTFTYGDYALNNDTHMEVQTAALQFGTADAANTWATNFAPGTPDQYGVASAYIPTGGTPAAGEYHYLFLQGVYGIFMVCKPSIDGEAASRECETPLETTAIAWKLALNG